MPADLVFVDETSTHTALTRRRARAPRGTRAVGRIPRNHGPNVTLLAALTPTGIGPAVTMPGAVDGAAFAAYAERVLAPSLRPGRSWSWTISVPTRVKSPQAVAAVGCRLLFLPAYSPDFNPIELAFAKVKERLRAAAERTPDGLFAATSAAIDAVSTIDAHGFSAHCGFPSRPTTMRTTLCVAQRSSGGLVAIAPRHWLLARGLLAVVVGLSAAAPGLLPSQELGDLGASAANDRVITARRSMATAGWRRGNLGGAWMTTTPRSRSARSRLRLHGPGPEGGRTPPASRMLCGICLLSAYPRVVVAYTQPLSANEPRRDAPGSPRRALGGAPSRPLRRRRAGRRATLSLQASPAEAGVA